MIRILVLSLVCSCQTSVADSLQSCVCASPSVFALRAMSFLPVSLTLSNIALQVSCLSPTSCPSTSVSTFPTAVLSLHSIIAATQSANHARAALAWTPATRYANKSWLIQLSWLYPVRALIHTRFFTLYAVVVLEPGLLFSWHPHPVFGCAASWTVLCCFGCLPAGWCLHAHTLWQLQSLCCQPAGLHQVHDQLHRQLSCCHGLDRLLHQQTAAQCHQVCQCCCCHQQQRWRVCWKAGGRIVCTAPGVRPCSEYPCSRRCCCSSLQPTTYA